MLVIRLDRFLIKEPLMDKIEMISKWVGSGGILDHLPIFLEIASISPYSRTPFKFNSTWLRDEDFHQLVKKIWQDSSHIRERSSTTYLAQNIFHLKKRTIEWAKAKKNKDKETLRKIEVELARLEDPVNGGYDSLESNLYVSQLKLRNLRY